MKHLLLCTVILLILSNVAWALTYRSLWYDAAQAEGMLDQAEAYIHSNR